MVCKVEMPLCSEDRPVKCSVFRRLCILQECKQLACSAGLLDCQQKSCSFFAGAVLNVQNLVSSLCILNECCMLEDCYDQ